MTGTSTNRATVPLIAIAVVVPVLLWWKFVSPVRQAHATFEAESRWLIKEREELRSKREIEGGVESDRVRSVRDVRRAFERFPSDSPGASEVYRRVEDAARQAGVRIIRTEPGSSAETSTMVGPLGLRELETSRRSFRLDFEADTVSVPYFLDLIQHLDEMVQIGELRLQGMPGKASSTTGTVVFELVSVRARDFEQNKAKEGAS